MANTNQVIVNGETILDLRSDTVTPETLQKGYTAHDKSGTKITGTLEAASSGGAKETWVLNNAVDTSKKFTYSVSFVSNGVTYSSISVSGGSAPGAGGMSYNLKYGGTTILSGEANGNFGIVGGEKQIYRKLIFSTPPTGDLLTWLQANGVKQPANLAVQQSKDVTVTSNGTTEITPDTPYDVMEKAKVTVNVAGGGGGQTTQLRVNVSNANIAATLCCVWQTNNGWIGTRYFDTSENFTVPNVTVGGYVIFTHDPNEEWFFSIFDASGVAQTSVAAMNPEVDAANEALVVVVTATSPSFFLGLSSNN